LSTSNADDFDLQAAWLRRFTADAESNLKAFALRLKEAMPDRVTIHESKGFFSAARTTGLSVELGDNRYRLDLAEGRLKASIALVVHGIALNTRAVDPAAWFARLTEETKTATNHAQALSQSLSDFMAH
jgi:hypothetical protein